MPLPEPGVSVRERTYLIKIEQGDDFESICLDYAQGRSPAHAAFNLMQQHHLEACEDQRTWFGPGGTRQMRTLRPAKRGVMPVQLLPGAVITMGERFQYPMRILRVRLTDEEQSPRMVYIEVEFTTSSGQPRLIKLSTEEPVNVWF